MFWRVKFRIRQPCLFCLLEDHIWLYNMWSMISCWGYIQREERGHVWQQTSETWVGPGLCVYACVCVYMCVEARGQHRLFFRFEIPEDGLAGQQALWLLSAQRCTYRCHSWHVCGCWGSRLGFLCLHGKHFTDGTIPPALPSPLALLFFIYNNSLLGVTSALVRTALFLQE